MTARLEKLLTPIAGSDPAGQDSAYEGWRTVMDAAFAGSGVSIDTPGGAKPVLPSEWLVRARDVEGRFSETKDLWLAVYLARGGALGRDIDMAVHGVEALAGLCERSWDGVHPRIDVVGIDGRVNACNDLAAPVRFLTPLLAIPAVKLPKAPAQTFQSIDDLRSAPNAGLLATMRKDLAQGGAEDFLASFAKLKQIEAALGRVEDAFEQKAGGATLKLEDIREALRRLIDFAQSLAGGGSKLEGALEQGSQTDLGGTSSPAPTLSGGVHNRAEVVRAIDAICRYYAESEPSSPVRTLLLRARDWVDKDFLALVADIMPDNVEAARSILAGQPKG